MRPETLQMQTTYEVNKGVKVCEYSRSRSFHDDLILQDQASGERSQDQWSSGSKIFFSETAWPIKVKFYVARPWVGGTKS